MTTTPDKYLLKREAKKTVKHSLEKYEEVKRRHKQGESIHSISKITGISRRMIQFILYPERMEKAKKDFAERQKDGRYRYETKVQTDMVREVRKRKKEILKSGADLLIKK